MKLQAYYCTLTWINRHFTIVIFTIKSCYRTFFLLFYFIFYKNKYRIKFFSSRGQPVHSIKISFYKINTYSLLLYIFVRIFSVNGIWTIFFPIFLGFEYDIFCLKCKIIFQYNPFWKRNTDFVQINLKHTNKNRPNLMANNLNLTRQYFDP